MHRTTAVPLLVVASLACIATVSLSSAFAVPRASPTPLRIATVNLTAVINVLASASPLINRPTSDAIALVEQTDLAKQVWSLESRISELTPGTPEHQELQADLAQATTALRDFETRTLARLEQQRDKQLQDLYSDVETCVRQIAESEGYDLVLVDDAQRSFGEDRDVRTQIRARRVLYTNRSQDITGTVLECLGR